MKKEIEKEKLEQIKILFVVVKATSDIIAAINKDSRSKQMSESSKEIIGYIESSEATAEGALERISDHVEKMRDIFGLPADPIEFDKGGIMSNTPQSDVRICEGEIVLSKKSLSIGYPCKDIPPLGVVKCPDSIESAIHPFYFDPKGDDNHDDDDCCHY